MEILKQVADQIILQPLYVTIVVTVYVENVNAIQGRILQRWFREIIVNATTFLVIATTEIFVPVLIMECVNAENVFVIQSGIVQVTPHANVEPPMTPVLRPTESSSILNVPGMGHVSVANANVRKPKMDNTLDSIVKTALHVQISVKSCSHVYNVNSSDPAPI